MANTDRLVRLRDFLAEGAGAPFTWGERDCALWASDWIKAERGNDPAERLRGTYGSALACARLLNDAGGLVALSAQLAARAGLIETDHPEAGDVGVLELSIGTFLAIRTREGWAVKASDGLAIRPGAATKAWAV